MRTPSLSTAALLLILPAVSQAAVISYGTSGGTINENFNTLASSGTTTEWANGTTLTGWHWGASTAFNNIGFQTAASGTSGQQNRVLSVGSSAGDRALGSQNASNDNHEIYIGVSLGNSTAISLTTFTLGYTGEQWRNITGTEAPDGYLLQYQVFDSTMGSVDAASGWTSAANLNFVSPTPTTLSNQMVDGELAANRTVISGSVSGLSWAPGQELWIRWVDTAPAAASANALRRSLGMLAVDDFSFSAVPEPSSALLALPALGLFLRRRRI